MFLILLQLLIAILLIGAILLQSQGTGLGAAWGGGGESYHTKRGLEKVIFRATILLVIAFSFLALLSLVS